MCSILVIGSDQLALRIQKSARHSHHLYARSTWRQFQFCSIWATQMALAEESETAWGESLPAPIRELECSSGVGLWSHSRQCRPRPSFCVVVEYWQRVRRGFEYYCARVILLTSGSCSLFWLELCLRALHSWAHFQIAAPLTHDPTFDSCPNGDQSGDRVIRRVSFTSEECQLLFFWASPIIIVAGTAIRFREGEHKSLTRQPAISQY